MSKPIPDQVLNFGKVAKDQVEEIDPNNIPKKLTERLTQTHPTPVSYTHLTLPTIYSV